MVAASVAKALKRGRAAFESRCRATCKIIRRTGELVTDDQGYEVPEIITVYDELPCYLSYNGVPYESTFDSAGVTITQGRIELITATGRNVELDDVVIMLKDPDNPYLEGTEYRVASRVPRSQGTRQRALLEDNQKGVSKVGETHNEDS